MCKAYCRCTLFSVVIILEIIVLKLHVHVYLLQLDIANVVPRPTTPPNAIATRDIIQQHRESPVKIIPEGEASGASGVGLGGGDGESAVKLNTDHLSASQQAVMNTLEQAGVVSWEGRGNW
jgi:hypothetical protein